METKGKGLDSIERRQLLAKILSIPPILLGIGSISDIEQFLGGYSGINAPRNSDKERLVNIDTYKDVLSLYGNMYHSGINNSNTSNLLQWTDRVKRDFIATRDKGLISVLSQFYRLAGDTLRDRLQFGSALSHLEEGLEIADNNEDTAALLYTIGKTRMDQGKPLLANASLTQAISLASDINAPLRGAIYQLAGLSTASIALDKSDSKLSLSLLDKAERLTTTKEPDTHLVKFSRGRYLLEKADALLTLKASDSALTVLDEADDEIPTAQQKRKGYLNILRAEVYLDPRNLDVDYATRYLTDAFVLSSQAESHYNVDYIDHLYTKVKKARGNNSGEVAELGANLSRWKKTH